ncbi:hypothetical protein P152DRAFT_31485 [Eremomyces bilateralis CBS 781.70]|uniref:SPX domain-containing protein n=1 Tax=Eremomyces bilateralis CBS 781.70 TaxID=1392243 RepID=A0A6G1G2Y4_9PEZI|nr:uncharacterized protein P152DRAFT_31485 [Eremomyces bilateralis CBS 781.70]KAF1812291.1 hypothetical protein P152DRAFT_31485 [Eremomyces bilateralis CBS 781.70]
MKFAKELEAELVPEWRAKYMNYKEGKKRLKALARAYRNLTGTPRAALSAKRKGIFTPRFTNDAIRPQNLLQSAEEDTARRNFPNRNAARTPDAASAKSPERNLATEPPNPINVPGRAAEKQPLHESPDYSGFGRYGSIIGTPPEESDLPELQKGLPSLELPGPALHSSAAAHTHDRARADRGAESGAKFITRWDRESVDFQALDNGGP